MSLLDAIRAKKSKLTSTETIFTTLDGRRFVQSKNQNQQISSSSYGFVVDTKPDNVPAKIVDHIYLGSQDCCELDILKAHNITSVLSVGIEPPCRFSHINYKFVSCLDLPETDITDVLVRDCVPFIENCVKCNSNVLVHCNAGVSRSATIVIGYLILVKNYTYDDAYSLVKIARCCIRPNKGFEEQLKRMSSVT